MRRRVKGMVTALALALILLVLFPLQSKVVAKGNGEQLREELNRLTYELLELRSRRNAAESDCIALREEMHALDMKICDAELSIRQLEEVRRGLQDSYNRSMRSLYKMGSVTELEIFLESQKLEDAWQDHAVYERLMASDGSQIEELEGKQAELDAKKRSLKEARQRRERIAETLDIQGLDMRINELEARLSEINDRLREKSASGAKGSGQGRRQQPSPWQVPSAGKVLDRVSSPPPLSDFERTGIASGGYTTCYGEEFDGSPTASGVIFHMYDYTCAHKTLPFGTWLLVTFEGRHVIVQVNDRGPFVPGRVLDLSLGAAQGIGLEGVQWTDFEVLVPKGN